MRECVLGVCVALRSAEVESWVLWSDATVNVDVKLERHDSARDESSRLITDRNNSYTS